MGFNSEFKGLICKVQPRPGNPSHGAHISKGCRRFGADHTYCATVNIRITSSTLVSKSNGALCNLCTSDSTNGWHCYFPFVPVVLLLLSLFHSFPPSFLPFILYYLKFGVGLTYFPNAFIRYVDSLAVLSFQIKISEHVQSDSQNCVTDGL